MIYITLSRSALAAGAAMLATLALATADARAADFQQYRLGTCANHRCTIDFSVVPAGKVLRASHASCYLRISNGSGPILLNAVQLLLRSASGGTPMAESLPMELLAQNTLNSQLVNVYEDNELVQVTASAGQHLQVFADVPSGDVQLFACHTSGAMTP